MVLRATLEKKEEKARVRAALMRAALQLGATHGFAGLGLREVAREAGIAPTSFYRHFADMEELGMALIRELAGRVVHGLAERAQTARKPEIVPELVDGMFRATAQDPELLRFMVAERAGAFAGLRALLRAELAQLARALHAAGTGEQVDSESAPPPSAEAAVALLFEACARTLDDERARHDKLRESLISTMRRLLSSDERTA